MAKIIGFLLIPLYTLYLTPEDYGIVELCASLGVFVVILMRLGVPGSVTRFYFDYKDDEKKLSEYVTAVHRFLLSSSVVVGIIAFFVLYYFGDQIFKGLPFYPFMVIVLISGVLKANSDLQKRLIIGKEQSLYSAKLNIAVAIVSISLTLLFVVGFKQGALGFILAQLITAIIFFAQAQYYLKPHLGAVFKPRMLKTSIKYGSGILPHHLFAAFSPLFARAILAAKTNIGELGLFSLAARFTQPLTLTLSMFTFAFQPVYFSLRKEAGTEQKVTNLLTNVWLLAVFFFLLVVFLLPPLIPLITPAKFHPCAPLIPILSVGFLGKVFYMIFSSEMFYQAKTKYISLITGSGMALNLLVAFFTVKKMGAYGIAWADSLCYIVWAIIAFIFFIKLNPFRVRFKALLFPLIVAVIGLIAALSVPVVDILFRVLILITLFLGLFFLSDWRKMLVFIRSRFQR